VLLSVPFAIATNEASATLRFALPTKSREVLDFDASRDDAHGDWRQIAHTLVT
jgi:hypothetical protein